MAYSKTTYGPYIPQTGGLSTTRSWTKVQSNSSTKRVKPKGLDLLKTTLYSASDSITRRSSMSQGGKYTATTTYPNPYGGAPEDFDNTTYQAARREALTKLLIKIKDEDWNLSTFIGELPETTRYLAKTLSTLVRTYRSVRKGDLREIRRMRELRPSKRPPVTANATLNATSGKWLEWRYAIQPLMFDTDSMLKALYQSRTRAILTRRVSGSTCHFYEKAVHASLGYNSYLYRHRPQTMNLRLGAYVRVNPDLSAFQRLGLLNPVATLWELLPLSFVVDWFIPIGQYVGSLDAMASSTIWSKWESAKGITQYIVTSGQYNSGYPNYNWGTYAENISEKRYYNRSASPSFTLSFPSFQLSMNTSRYLDAFALAKQMLLSGR